MPNKGPLCTWNTGSCDARVSCIFHSTQRSACFDAPIVVVSLRVTQSRMSLARHDIKGERDTDSETNAKNKRSQRTQWSTRDPPFGKGVRTPLPHTCDCHLGGMPSSRRANFASQYIALSRPFRYVARPMLTIPARLRVRQEMGLYCVYILCS
jgi:hypothetical protein